MCCRGSGLILNVGSFAGMIPTPFLQTYSGSKAFLSTWSEALAQEVRPHGVHVEHLNTYFVVSNMSKMRGSLLVPSASVYVKNVLKRCGSKTHSTPYPLHNLMSWFLETFVSKELLAQKTYEMQTKVRQRALKKLERMKNE
jgi:17beta-estradiol 17-dehydrogenase / very-long-chain 3-oxoacyl-CoA reductase